MNAEPRKFHAAAKQANKSEKTPSNTAELAQIAEVLKLTIQNQNRAMKIADRLDETLKSLTPGRWVGTPEMAQQLGLDEKTVRKLVADGKIPAARTSENGVYMYDPAKVKKALKTEN